MLGGIAWDAVRAASSVKDKAADGAADAAAEAARRRQLEAEERAELAAASSLAPRLDEAARYLGRYIAAPPAYIDAMALIAAQTWVAERGILATTPRALWTAEQEEAAKTLAMTITALLSRHAVNTVGTWYSVQAEIAAAQQEGRPCPTLYRDEISGVFGTNGFGGASNQLADIIRQGYRYDATSAWAVNRQSVRFSTFATFYMTGLKAALPRDVRSRCIVFPMERGVPSEYFDVRDAEAEGQALATALGRAVRGNKGTISDFRIRRLRHPSLQGRKGEIWEPLFAVAAAAGQEWLNRCMAAFLELATDQAEIITLSPEQELLRDCALIAAGLDTAGDPDILNYHGEAFIPSRVLASELRRLDGSYAQLTDVQLSTRFRALPVESTQARFGELVKRGYMVAELAQAWLDICPDGPADVAVWEEDDPFADVPYVPGVTDVPDESDTMEGVA